MSKEKTIENSTPIIRCWPTDYQGQEVCVNKEQIKNKFKVGNVKSYPRYCKDNLDDILCCRKTITTLGNEYKKYSVLKDCNVLTSEEYLTFYNDDIAKTTPIDNNTYEKYFNEMKENLRKLESQLTTNKRISQNKNDYDTSDSKYLKIER
ncbi:hypothetical protein PIROE2DRAFT_15002 [Piromyces sp. E2]|nr:hypothetical protein PIROE2DRAFT_15002 [Piromyces sp. E2]|eukprot:OUM59476.1 hypothetical protein PIROE2DRAFT_15002 [Piromyces sp. E2]